MDQRLTSNRQQARRIRLRTLGEDENVDETLPSTSAKGIVALVAVNLAWNIGISWCLRSEDVAWALVLVALLFVSFGTLVAQTFVLAIWMSFSEVRWHWRWAVPVLIVIALSTACGLGAGADILQAAAAALSLLVLLGLLVALLVPLRRVRGWRLTARQNAMPGEVGRFRISDLLIWMVVIALPLAIVRFIATHLSANDFNPGVRAIALSLLLLLPLLWLALLTAFAPRERQTHLLASAALAYAAVVTGLAAILVYPSLEDLLWPLPGWYVVWITGAFFASGATVALKCCLALRAFGYRLRRPAWTVGEGPGRQSGIHKVSL